MVQGLEGHLVTPSWRLCEILGGSPQLGHIGLVPGVFICKPLAYLDCDICLDEREIIDLLANRVPKFRGYPRGY